MVAWRAAIAAFVVAVLALHPLAGSEIGDERRQPNKRVLVLYDSGRLLPANVEGERGINDGLGSNKRFVDVDAEFLETPRFEGDDYLRAFATYLHDKYTPQRPDVIIAAGERALDFVLQNRSKLFPNTPVVHAAVYDPGHFTLPPDVRGVPVRLDVTGTIEQALRFHPHARRLVIVTGASKDDREWENLLRNDLSVFGSRFESVDYLTGLPTAEVLRRVSKLGSDSIVFTPGYNVDGESRTSIPREIVRAMANASAAPVYGPFSTFIGTGVVGGSFTTFYQMGVVAGEIAGKILDGQAPNSIELPKVMPTTFTVDWRQIKRWGIDESALPANAEVQFRSPGFWEQYRTIAIWAMAAFLLQSGLLGGLLLERHRRRRAELATERHRFELAHASRLAVAGELTASIAHELNQPLTAIVLNLDVATRLIDRPHVENELREVLEDIRRDDVRAGEIIRRLRRLFAKQEVERTPLDINEAVGEVASVLRAQARDRRVAISIQPSPDEVRIIGDKIQIQQVLLNLVLNAIDAVKEAPPDRRVVFVAVGKGGRLASIAITDHGPGIKAEHLPKLFDSFFSTKKDGFGLGLSIVRTLVEAHGGRVWAENRSPNGATFHVELPLDGAYPPGKTA